MCPHCTKHCTETQAHSKRIPRYSFEGGSGIRKPLYASARVYSRAISSNSIVISEISFWTPPSIFDFGKKNRGSYFLVAFSVYLYFQRRERNRINFCAEYSAMQFRTSFVNHFHPHIHVDGWCWFYQHYQHLSIIFTLAFMLMVDFNLILFSSLKLWLYLLSFKEEITWDNLWQLCCHSKKK